MGCYVEAEPSDLEVSEAGPAPPRPVLPEGLTKLPIRQRLKAIQQFISSFEYNYTPNTYFNVRKKRPLKRIVDTGRQIIRDALPIKCVEAVFLAILLTSEPDIERIPMGFKTAIDGQEFRHIVLIVKHGGKFGALGISRRKELMYKDLIYDSLSAIVTDFKQSYEHWWHTVLKIRVGLPIERDVHSQNQICWRFLMLKVATKPWEECCAALDAHAACALRLWDKWILAQSKLAQSKKRPDAATANAPKGRISPDSELDGDACPVLSDGPIVATCRNGKDQRPLRRFGRPSQNSRKRKENGMASVKSAPDLQDLQAAQNAKSQSNELVSDEANDSKSGPLMVELDREESESDSDSDAPCSPPARAST